MLIGVYSDTELRRFEELCRMLAVFKIRPVVDKVFVFEDAQAAFAYLGKQEHIGKVVIQVSKTDT